MPQVPLTCAQTGQPVPDYLVHTLDGNFVDGSGRTLLLRGVNLSGSSKAPVGHPSHILKDFWEAGEAGSESFVGQPLNLADGSADEHLRRLRGWGFNMLRYPITWEALEHEGPGKYDYEFIDYTIRVLRKCKEYGFKVYLDPHQDVWSRFSGGSGAPYWTLPACGINPRAFTATQAAILHCEYPSPPPDSRDPASLPSMIWSTNYGRLASQTLFALFFGGRTFAPKCIIDGINIQDYLQFHFTRAFAILAERIRDAGGLLDEVVIGWDGMNEPAEGFIAYPDLNVYPTVQGSTLKKGSVPSPAQSFRLGMGIAQTVDYYTLGGFGPIRDGTVTIDPCGASIWADPADEPGGVHPRWKWRRDPQWKLGLCVWALHGVWDVETGYILQPDYFRYLPLSTSVPTPPSAESESRVEVDFLHDFFLPQVTSYFSAIRAAHPNAIAFVQVPVFAVPPEVPETLLQGRACAAPHYYDGLTLISRHWNWYNADALGMIRGKYSHPVFAVRLGEKAIRACIRSQLGVLKADAVQLGTAPLSAPSLPSSPLAVQARYPTIIGEIGTPFDMDRKASYDPSNPRYGDYGPQERALDASLSAADGANALNYTVWTYCTDSTHRWSDGWNMEDLSLWSSDDLACRIGSPTSTDVTMNGGVGMMTPAHASTATLATLRSASLPYASVSEPAHVRLAFLRDGARAVKAFCRPWPVSTVGVPSTIEFDIGKATVKILVTVRAGDMPRVYKELGEDEGEGEEDTEGAEAKSEKTSGSGTASVHSLESEKILEEKPSPLPTEIFLPLVHFASETCVSRSLVLAGQQQAQTIPDGDADPDTHGTGCVPTGTATPNTYTASTATLLLSSPRLNSVSPSEIRIANEAYDVTVKMSEGHVELCERTQMLRWFYSVPTTPGARKEVWIEVKRTGSAIKYPRGAGARSRKGRAGFAGWLEGLSGGDMNPCPESCIVM
ncbi:glycoside hydrolase family 5 protein [Pisolithus croceorrhizus]|nr:glycoside hydrolase family 5 protein [Pisolithus croceorrhizus]